MPVQQAEILSQEELVERRIILYNLFGIAAAASDGGIQFAPGVSVPDQPLLAALDVLLDRRFAPTPRPD